MPTYDLGTARGRIELDTNDLQQAEVALKQAGRGLLTFGAVALAGFGLAVKASADFESRLSHISAVTGATEADVNKLREAALKLGVDTAYGAKAAADAFVELAKAGLSVKQILDGAGDAAVQLAAAGDIPIAQAAEVAVNTMQTFNLEAADMVKIADLLAGAANASTVEVEDLAVSLKYAGSVAAAQNISLEETATALAMLGNAGIRGSTGGTSLRRVLLNLSPASKAAREVMKDLGIITSDGANRFYDASGSAKDLAEVFQILQDATKDLTDEQKVQSLSTIFGARAVSSALILAREGAEGFKDMQDQVTNVTALEVMEERLDNVSGAMQKFKATIETLLITGGGPFQDTIQGFIEGLTELLKIFTKLPAPVVVFLTGSLLLIGVLSVLSGALLLTVGHMLQAYRLLVTLAPVMATVTSGVGALTAAIGRMAIALLTNPVFLIIAALVLLGYAFYRLYQDSEAFRNFIDGIWQGMQKAWDAIVGFFKRLPGMIADAWGSVTSTLSDFWGEVVSAAESAWESIKAAFDDFLGIITGSFTAAADAIADWASDVAGLADRVGEDLMDAGRAVLDFFKGLPDRIGEAASDLVRLINQWGVTARRFVAYHLGFIVGRFLRIFFYDIPRIVIGAGVKIVQAILKWAPRIPGIIGRALATAAEETVKFTSRMVQLGLQLGVKFLNTVVTWTGEVIAAIVSWIADMIGMGVDLGVRFLAATIAWLERLPGIFADILAAVISALLNFLGQVLSISVQIGSGFVSTLVGWLSRLPGNFAQWLSTAVSTVAGFIGRFASTAWSIGSSIVSGIVGGIGDLAGAVWQKFEDLLGSIGGFAARLGRGAKDMGKSMWDGFWEGISGSPHTKIEYAVWDMVNNVGKSINQLRGQVGTIQSMTGMIPTVVPAAAGLVTAPYGAAATPTPGPNGEGLLSIEINNPVGEPTEESLHRTMQKLAFHGILPSWLENV